MIVCKMAIFQAIAEVTGAWWCPWSSKPVWGREGPGWVRFPFASAIITKAEYGKLLEFVESKQWLVKGR